MPDNARWRLSLMMFLEYVIWGSWLPLLALYLSRFLGFSGTEIGWIFATQAIASVAAVFVSGQVALLALRPVELEGRLGRRGVDPLARRGGHRCGQDAAYEGERRGSRQGRRR